MGFRADKARPSALRERMACFLASALGEVKLFDNFY